MSKSEIEEQFALQIKTKQLPEPSREFKFLPTRRFRFDFAYPDLKIAVEIEGGSWTGGRHTTGSGFRKDCEKYNLAALTGWKVFRFTTDMVRDGIGITILETAIKKDCGGKRIG